ncbi:MAG: sigma-70 family RNA polymerase sigma factor [Ignavibacteriaceae bacterium]|nr:sigma-70 family RNA polymerase sigma factor [Ignavibacteriaceae bacterium]
MLTEKDFDGIIKEYGRSLRTICINLLHDTSNAEDVYQEVLLKIWKNIGSFRGESSVKTWVSRIAVNVAITGLNREKKKKKIFLPLFPAERKIPSADDPGKAAEISQKVEFFKKFFQTLSDTEKALVTLYLEEYTTAEMAGITGLTEANVRVRIHRLKSKVKEEWERNYESR